MGSSTREGNGPEDRGKSSSGRAYADLSIPFRIPSVLLGLARKHSPLLSFSHTKTASGIFLPRCSLNCVVSRDLSAGQEEEGGATGDAAHPSPYKSIQKVLTGVLYIFLKGYFFRQAYCSTENQGKERRKGKSEGASEGERKMEKKNAPTHGCPLTSSLFSRDAFRDSQSTKRDGLWASISPSKEQGGCG